jgi:hypothetical protein
VLTVVHSTCDLLSLVRLGCSSKAGKRLVAAVVLNNLQEVICRALQDAAAPEGDITRVHVLQWLLTAVAQHRQQHQQQQEQNEVVGSMLDGGSLLMVPQVPAAAAQALVAAGLLITEQQLCDAAAAQVEGLEVWLQAHEALNIPNVLLPGWAHSICCNRHEVGHPHRVFSCAPFSTVDRHIVLRHACSPADLYHKQAVHPE